MQRKFNMINGLFYSLYTHKYIYIYIMKYVYIYILLSNDLGQRDASDIPIWLPAGLSHVP